MKIFAARKEEFHEKIDEGWKAAKRNELIDGDEVFDRIDAELEAMERSPSE